MKDGKVSSLKKTAGTLIPAAGNANEGVKAFLILQQLNPA
jgi:hypothetical protein